MVQRCSGAADRPTSSHGRDRRAGREVAEQAHVQHVVATALAAKPRATPASGTNIVASWRRCLTEYGLAPDRLPPAAVLTQRELSGPRAPIDDLIAIATGEMMRLFEHLDGADYIMMLTDANGVTVSTHLSASLREEARSTRSVLGSIWTEESQGTNGIGTCLKERAPLSVVMTDHFGTRLLGLSCTVAPIFDAGGDLVGALDVTTPRPSDHLVQTLVRRTVALSARRIENIYVQRQYPGQRVLRMLAPRRFRRSGERGPDRARRSRPHRRGNAGCGAVAGSVAAVAGPPQAARYAAGRRGAGRRCAHPVIRTGRRGEICSCWAAHRTTLCGECPEPCVRRRRRSRGSIPRSSAPAGCWPTACRCCWSAKPVPARRPWRGAAHQQSPLGQAVHRGELRRHRRNADRGRVVRLPARCVHRGGAGGRAGAGAPGRPWHAVAYEIGEIPLALQTRLLHVLSEGE